MKTINTALAAALAGTAAAVLASAALAAPDKAQVDHGYKLYVATGCYQCHGYEGSGGGAGPRIAGPPLPMQAFEHQLRDPRQRMPIYTEKVMPQADVEAIYAYLQSIPRSKPASQIPLLQSMP